MRCEMQTIEQSDFQSFAEFYPFYLQEHGHPNCRRLHFVGTTLVLAVLAFVLVTQQWVWLWALPVIGYGFAWVGHFFIEHNRPATFQYPSYSLAGDFVMWKGILVRRIDWEWPLWRRRGRRTPVLVGGVEDGVEVQLLPARRAAKLLRRSQQQRSSFYIGAGQVALLR